MKLTQTGFLVLLGSVLHAEGSQRLQEGAVQTVEPAADCINCDGTPLESSADMSLPPRRARSLHPVPLNRKKRGIVIMDIDSESDGEEISVPLIYKKRSEDKLIPMQLQKMPKATKLIGVIEPEAVRYTLEQPDVANDEKPRKKQAMLMVLLPTTRTFSNVGSSPSPRMFGVGKKLFDGDKNLALTFGGKGSMELEGGINVGFGRGRGTPRCDEVSSRFGGGEAGLVETLGGRVGENIGRSIGRGVGGGIGAGIGRSIGGKVGGNLGESLLGCVGSDIGTSIGQDIGEGIGRTVGSSIGEGIGEGIGKKVGGGFGRAIDKIGKKYVGKIGRGQDGISVDSLENSESELGGDEESAEIDDDESDDTQLELDGDDDDDAGEDNVISIRSGFRGAPDDSLGYRSGLNDDQLDRTGSRVAGRQFSPRIFGIGRKVVCHLASLLDCERRDQHNRQNIGSVTSGGGGQGGGQFGGGGQGGGQFGGGGQGGGQFGGGGQGGGQFGGGGQGGGQFGGRGQGGGQFGGGGQGGGQFGGGGQGGGNFEGEGQIGGSVGGGGQGGSGGGGGSDDDCCDCNDPTRLCKARGCCDCYYKGGVRICGKFRGEGSFAGKGNLGSLGKFDGKGRVRGEGQFDAGYLGNGKFGGKGKFGGDGEFSGQISLG